MELTTYGTIYKVLESPISDILGDNLWNRVIVPIRGWKACNLKNLRHLKAGILAVFPLKAYEIFELHPLVFAPRFYRLQLAHSFEYWLK